MLRHIQEVSNKEVERRFSYVRFKLVVHCWMLDGRGYRSVDEFSE